MMYSFIVNIWSYIHFTRQNNTFLEKWVKMAPGNGTLLSVNFLDLYLDVHPNFENFINYFSHLPFKWEPMTTKKTKKIINGLMVWKDNIILPKLCMLVLENLLNKLKWEKNFKVDKVQVKLYQLQSFFSFWFIEEIFQYDRLIFVDGLN